MARADDYRKNFRDNLKAIQINLGYTQAELSLEAGYDSTYVGKLERGSSDPAIATVKKLGEALDIDPFMLLSPKLAHLNLLQSVPPEEIKTLPFNPLDIEIIDSMPYPMGIMTPKATPVYINDAFVESADVERDAIGDKSFLELSFWNLTEGVGDQLTKTLATFEDDIEAYIFNVSLESQDDENVQLSFYPSPRDREQSTISSIRIKAC